MKTINEKSFELIKLYSKVILATANITFNSLKQI
ncbi:MAG: hypothetical protein ucyna2_00414 [Candidatus Atelocyanobacterium thalassa isolate SIO64986]|uniref:Uncharacterized protein n=1 Tax=Candidatus Atelocyanobacterium thalassa isolate SIO64986 TaxID=1527444 RepID=A0A086CHX1_9CHRO|nr:MAG: hypothetical protein ucyna2_00414 [Candidatus Atelocyanobacterium thalassa isolate SIO64986]